MIKLMRVKNTAWADTMKRDWLSGVLDARHILRPMQVEAVYMNPTDVIAVQPATIRVGWDEMNMERPCRSVGEDQPWWIDKLGSLVHVRQVGKWTVLETPCIVQDMIHEALS